MSGGVDSSVAALLMCQRGYDCTGITMRLVEKTCVNAPAGQAEVGPAVGQPEARLPEVGPEAGPAAVGQGAACQPESGPSEAAGAPEPDAVADARRVCQHLGIPHHTLEMTADFTNLVIRPFVATYLRGQTPNPCVICNQRIKFGLLWQKAQELGVGFDVFVTGHYARCQRDAAGQPALYRASDSSKDQSYVLYTLSRDQLARICLPLGSLTKRQVRDIAQEHGLPVAHKAESQDICFIPNHDYAAFVDQQANAAIQPGDAAAPPGNIVDRQGNVLGQHQGIHHYTIGQRKALGIAVGQPLYVLELNAPRQEVVVGRASELYVASAQLKDLNLQASLPFSQATPVLAQYRYNSSAHPATLCIAASGQAAQVSFDRPQKAVAPGQSLVCYIGDRVVAGGQITRTTPATAPAEAPTQAFAQAPTLPPAQTSK